MSGITRPALDQETSYPLAQSIRLLQNAVDQLLPQIDAVSARVTTPLTLNQIRRALGATGGQPLNVFQLIGSPGVGSGIVNVGTHAERLGSPANQQQPNTLWVETDRQAMYAVLNGIWTLVVSAGLRVVIANLPTDLGASDNGFYAAATDFARVYLWTGAAWTDAPGQPARGQIVDFPDSFPPGVGWQLCDGSAGVSISTAAGSTAVITVPDLTSANRFRRATAGATGGTGGASPSTSGVPSAVTMVDVTVPTVNVGSDVHTHDTPTLPPYMDEQPFIRL